MNAARKLLIAAACLLLASPVFAQPYTYSPDGTEVTDGKTGLTWRRCSEGQTWNGSTCAGKASTYTHEQALVHAQTQTGWRLPNVKELASIIDRSQIYPAIDPAVFPGTYSGGYWTSTPNSSDPSYVRKVYFTLGYLCFGTRSHVYNVRLVR